MINRLLLFLILPSFLLVSGVYAQEAVSNGKPSSVPDEQVVSDFLLDPKNPFLKLTPPPKPVPIAPKKISPEVVEKKVEIPIEQEAQKLKIGGLVWGTDDPQAIINDQIVSQGDTIEKLLIFKIGPQGVVVKNKEGSSFLIKNEIK